MFLDVTHLVSNENGRRNLRERKKMGMAFRKTKKEDLFSYRPFDLLLDYTGEEGSYFAYFGE